MTVMSQMPNWLSARSKLSADRLALTNGQQTWSFGQLDRYVSQLATRMFHMGVRAGQRIAVLAESNMKIVAIIHALIQLGAVLVPVNPRLSSEDTNTILLDADPWLVIGTLPRETPFSRSITPEVLWHDLEQEPLYRSQPINLSDIQCLMYTSGTTGRPKGALISYGNIYYSAVSSAIHNGTTSSDLWLHVMPLFHIGGLSILFRSVITGNGIVLLPRFDPEHIQDTWSRYPVSLVSLVPTMLFRLLKSSLNFPASLRLILLGGAPPSASFVRQARAARLPVVLTYGLTETSSQIATQLLQDKESDTSAGHPIYPTEIAILSENGIICEPGTTGEIVVKGPTVFKGYWKQPQKTQEIFWEGWLRTGDVGHLNDNGSITVIDRQKDLIIRGGENISPVEIERVFTAHPLISDAGVLPINDEEWGQVPVIILVTDPQLTRQQCSEWANAHLSSIKRPVAYYHADSLPRTASGKLRRTELLKIWQSGAYYELL